MKATVNYFEIETTNGNDYALGSHYPEPGIYFVNDVQLLIFVSTIVAYVLDPSCKPLLTVENETKKPKEVDKSNKTISEDLLLKTLAIALNNEKYSELNNKPNESI